MTITEAVLEGLKTTVIGLTIVFSVLIILMLVLKLFEKIFYKQEKPKAADPVKEAEPVNKVIQSAAQEDDTELIAVLTAAAAASLGVPAGKMRIRSYRRIDNNVSAWNRAGIRETIESRLN